MSHLALAVYDFIFDVDIDKKTLARDSHLLWSIIVTYVVSVKWIGPSLMRNRKPLNIQKLIITYNCAQVIANCAYMISLVRFGVSKWPLRCMLKQRPEFEEIIKEAHHLMWYMFLIKIADLLDTIFFVLRKKNGQVSVLHVFHHIGMILLCQKAIHFHDAGYYAVVGFSINSFVHVVMYFYYFLSAFGPGMRKHLWWKPYITLLQMLQFCLILMYMGAMFAVGCEEFGATEIATFAYTAFLLALFYNFYKRTFVGKATLPHMCHLG